MFLSHRAAGEAQDAPHRPGCTSSICHILLKGKPDLQSVSTGLGAQRWDGGVQDSPLYRHSSAFNAVEQVLRFSSSAFLGVGHSHSPHLSPALL